MIQREILAQLREWKNREHRKPLVLRGARQVGKTTVVEQFGREFDVFIKLNLERSEDARVFSLTDNVMELLQYVCLQHKAKLNPQRSTLLFIDEIQNEPKAVAMLRYFYEDVPWLYVVAAGSRLQTLLKQRVSFPVGRVEYLSLRPCSFTEYLQAVGDELLIDKIRNLSVSPTLHDALMSRFNRYTLVGGMPEIVCEYAKSNNIASISPVYRSLLDGYNEDVEKYAKNEAQTRIIQHILHRGWNEAGQSIIFARFGGSSYASKDVHEAFNVMEKAFLLSLVYPLTSVKAPAIPALRRSPKLVWVDTGMMNFSVNIQLDYLQNTEIMDVWRGHSAEQMVAQELRVVLDRNFRNELFYWVRDKQGASAEVDFVWQSGSSIIPIEVKAGTNSHLRSIQSFMSQPDACGLAVRIWSGPYSVDELVAPNGHAFRLLNVPFYYVCMLDKLIADNIR